MRMNKMKKNKLLELQEQEIKIKNKIRKLELKYETYAKETEKCPWCDNKLTRYDFMDVTLDCKNKECIKLNGNFNIILVHY